MATNWEYKITDIGYAVSGQRYIHFQKEQKQKICKKEATKRQLISRVECIVKEIRNTADGCDENSDIVVSHLYLFPSL